jgi:hypothetical protein
MTREQAIEYVKAHFETVLDDEYPDEIEECVMYLWRDGFSEEEAEEIVTEALC